MIYISKGNKKVDAAIFNLPAGITCRPDVKCQGYCYAKKAERLYPNVKPCRLKNLEASKDTKSFIIQVDRWVKKHKPRYFRIHEAGDFYSVDYIKAWYQVAHYSPDTTFYCYTKRSDLFNAELLKDKPSNLIINWSVDGVNDPGLVYKAPSRHYDGVCWVSKDNTNCPAQINKEVKCGSGCTKCMTSGCRVVFKKH
jgi:hypothetical protein